MTWPGTFSITSGFSSEPFLPLGRALRVLGCRDGFHWLPSPPRFACVEVLIGKSTKSRSAFSYYSTDRQLLRGLTP